LVRSQICKWEVKEQPELHILRIHHVTIRSELKHFIGARYLGLQRPGYEVETVPNANGPGISCGKSVAKVRFRFEP
jgi:hypothetical protein